MSDAFDEILATLPEKQPRSRLEPYGELIRTLLRRRRTYREVASILVDRCHVHASISTIHGFVRRRAVANRKGTGAAGSQLRRSDRAIYGTDNGATTEGVQRRITAVKRQPITTQTQTEAAEFQYDPREPLRVPPKRGSHTTAG